VNTVLRGLRFQPGEKILYFSFIYPACGNTVLYVAESTGAAALHMQITLPVSDDDLLAAFSSTVQAAGNVKIAVFDTIVSLPGVRLPFERLIRTCKALGVLSMVDGAHAVGHLPLDITALDPDFLTSNCHKWLYTPRGSAFLYVAERNQALIRSTLPTSWGFVPLPSSEDDSTPPPKDEEAWAKQFTFVGTVNGSEFLCIPAALAFRKRIGGEDKIMAYTCDIARRGAEIFRALFETEIMKSYGTGPVGMFNIRLPLRFEEVPEEKRARVVSFLTDSMDACGTYITAFEYNGAWWSRVSGQIYLEESDFVKGAQILLGFVAKVRSGEW
jgi:selenocysteine lyase/cysteine desulfurase